MNEYQNNLWDAGFVRVDGIVAYAHGDLSLAFVIPKPSDYPGKIFILGDDFIFVLQKESDQTWYKSVDLSKNEGFRSNLFYVGYHFDGEDHDVRRDGVHIEKTAFAYHFVFDQEMFEARGLAHSYDPEIDIETIHSCESVVIQCSGDISKTVDQYIGSLQAWKEEVLKPLPNLEFLKVFGIKSMNEYKVVLPGHLRHFYMLVVLLSWREGKFPYGLTYKRFHELLVTPQPPVRYK